MNRRIFFILSALAGMTLSAGAQTLTGVSADDVKMKHSGDNTTVDMNLDLSQLKVKKNRAVLIIPTLVSEADSTELKSVGVYGRRRYYYYKRNYKSMLSGDDGLSYKARLAPATVPYHTSIEYEPWHSGASLILKTQLYGCCGNILAEGGENLGSLDEGFVGNKMPQLLYVKPAAQLHKEYAIKGSAYICFPVNETVIYDTYKNNTAELGKIESLIDTLKNEKDVTITSITLKGYASPEGSYANNVRLAAGRTEALKQYISKLYNFDPAIIKAESEPEDWDGLRKFISESDMLHKDALLDIANSNLEPDQKEARIRTNYPTDFVILSQLSFPWLRHTDYTISCDVKRFIDPEEIRAMLKRNPAMLSLNEIYLLADTYEQGTEEFNELYETAVRLFPNDETANLNVANNAIRRGEYDKAAQYLDKAGQSGEAIYTRGVLAFMQGDKDKAKELFEAAKAAGIDQATDALAEME
jgi:tetratricopeptide (TPR) repeat protein